MSSLEHARIASLVTSVGEHAEQIAELADRLGEAGEEAVVAALYEAERSLQMARRSLDRASDGLRGRG